MRGVFFLMKEASGEWKVGLFSSAVLFVCLRQEVSVGAVLRQGLCHCHGNLPEVKKWSSQDLRSAMPDEAWEAVAELGLAA